MTAESTLHRDSRLAKLNNLQEQGYNPYPYVFKPTAYAADLQEKYKDLEKGFMDNKCLHPLCKGCNFKNRFNKS